MSELIHQSLARNAMRTPDAPALAYQQQRLSYAELAGDVGAMARALCGMGLQRCDRVAIYLEKRIEAVTAIYGTSLAGGAFVPINPLLKSAQVGYILRNCEVGILVTSAERLALLGDEIRHSPSLHTVLLVNAENTPPALPGIKILGLNEASANGAALSARPIDADLAAILYTSGSTGMPKGVALSHRNLAAGAASVAQYLENSPEDRLLCVLPLSFDYGLSQLTTAFLSGASAVLMNYLLPRDVVRSVESEGITGLAAVPPLWSQLARQKWAAPSTLRYITNSGGAMPKAVLDTLRNALPSAKIFLMYGLTEAFRSSYLAPEEIERRPDSIGKAIPNAEILVVRKDGSRCQPNEAGELVHRGALVALGYWNDPEQTALRFRPAPNQAPELPFPEIAVWSGDTVRMDEEGFLYFVGRDDEMIKTSGYRVSPTEIEQVLLSAESVLEAAVFGVPDSELGQAVAAIVVASNQDLTPDDIIRHCQRELPAFMLPAHVKLHQGSLPRNPNGKIDRKTLQQGFAIHEASK